MEDMKKMFQSILAEIENMSQTDSVELGGHTPLFDEDWYCP
jgi:hypothetical protein